MEQYAQRVIRLMVMLTSIVKGMSWLALATAVKAGIQFAIFILLARSLSLSELGVLAFITLLVSISQLLSDAGISNAIIYFDNLTLNMKKQLYVLGFSFIFFTTLLVVLVLPKIEAFFNIATLADYQIWITFLLLLRGASAQPMAIMQKRLWFKKIALLEVIASIFSFVTLIYFLWLGAGVQSALAAHLVNAIVIVVVTSVLCKAELGFALPRLAQLKAPLKYGLYQSGEGLVSFLSRQFDQLAVAKVMGTEVLGVYSYIKELVAKPALQFINPIVNRVAFPSLVKLKKQARGELYLKLLTLLGCINIPLYVGVFWYAESVLQLAFGQQWLQYSEVVSMMAITMLFVSLINPCGPLLQASGAVKRSFLWNLVLTFIRSVVIIVMVWYGLYELVFALAIFQCGVLCLHWPILVKPCTNQSIIRFIRSQALAVFLTVLALGCTSVITNHFQPTALFGLILYALVLLLSIVGVLFLFRPTIHSMFFAKAPE